MSDALSNCPACGAVLPKNAPRGLCPKCLIRANVSSWDKSQSPGTDALMEPAQGIFRAALEQPSEERSAFVRGACHGNEELRCRVEELLQAFAGSSKVLAD